MRLGFDVAVSNINSKIWVFWRDNFQCSIILNEKQLVSIKCNHSGNPISFFVTVVCAKCSRAERMILWDRLAEFSNIDSPWLIEADFNIVRKAEERLEGRDIEYAATTDFNNCIASCGLLEPGFIGSKYTWQKGSQRFWQRLDRHL